MKKIFLVAFLFLYSIVSLEAQTIDTVNGTTLTSGEAVTVPVTITESGEYTFNMQYIPINTTSEEISYYLYIDGEKQQTVYQLSKQYTPEEKEATFDRYGNEIPLNSSLTTEVVTDNVHVKEQKNTQGVTFDLSEGTHEIKFELISGEVKLFNIVPAEVTTVDYVSYIATNAATEVPAPYVIEAEDIYLKNSAGIQSVYSGDKEAAPYSIENQYINTLGGGTFSTPGLSVTYQVTVEQAGYYPLAIKYLMTDDTMPVYITVEVNGEVPFVEMQNYRLPSSEEFTVHTFGNEDGAYLFYFEEGISEISISLNFATYEPYIDALNEINKQVNQIYLDVQKVTGNNDDPNISWDLENYLPGITEELNTIYASLETVYNELISLNGGNSNKVTHYISLAMDTLAPFLTDVNSLPSNLNLLYASTSSVGSYISTAITELGKTPILLDQIYVGGNESTYPDYDKNFVQKFGISIAELGYSFINKNDQDIQYEDSIDVWVFRSQQYVDQLQKMVDEDFSPETGVKVNLSIMTTDQQLLLSNAANNPPDVVLGLPVNLVFEYGVRGAAYDLSTFEDFDEVAAQFMPAALVPYAVDGGVYGLPETQDFNVLFYRTDIVEQYNLEVPETWEDVAELMPTLDRYSMTFYTNLSSGAGTKTLAQTSPFFLQNGCTFYNEEDYTTTLDSEECVESMTTMTELFTIYGVPLQVPNFFEYFRNGKAPMGVGNFSTYLQLMTAAPELEGKWAIAPMPGTEQEDGTISHAAPISSHGVMMLQKTENPEGSWEFIKWWVSTETQTEYAYGMYYTYGPAYLWNSANIQAFIDGPFPEKDKAVVLEQWSYAEEVAKIPGTYMLEREISNAWNAIVFEGENVQEAMETAKINVDREIQNKMTEFGYMEDGEIIKEYDIPTVEEMEALVNE